MIFVALFNSFTFYTFVIVLALYIFEALNGKPVGDGKPVKHPVSSFYFYITYIPGQAILFPYHGSSAGDNVGLDWKLSIPSPMLYIG